MKAVFAPRIAGAVLLALAASFAQSGAPAAVRWAEGAPNATSEVKNDMKVEGLNVGDVHVFASLVELKQTEYNRVWLQVSNHGKSPIDFDPQSAALVNGSKSVHPEAPGKAAKSIQKAGEAKSQELSSAHCNMLMRGGTAGSACTPTNTQMQMSKQVVELSSKQAQWIRDNALAQKSLAPGEEEQGAIVFRKDKKSADYILRIPVGAEIFEFPVNAQNKAPSYD